MSEADREVRAKRENKRQGLSWAFKRLQRLLKDGLGALFYVTAIVLVVVSGWAAFTNIRLAGWNSDAASWVQAAGSIAAIAGAAWLAQSEARRARRVRREQHEEAAWYVRFAIVQAQLESHIVAAELVNRTTPVEEGDVHRWRQQIATSAITLNALASRVDYVHPAVTQVTSNAKVLIDDLSISLAELAQIIKDGKQPEQDIIGGIVSPHRALIELIEMYDARMRGILIALDEGDDALPIKNWASWNQNYTAPPVDNTHVR